MIWRVRSRGPSVHDSSYTITPLIWNKRKKRRGYAFSVAFIIAQAAANDKPCLFSGGNSPGIIGSPGNAATAFRLNQNAVLASALSHQDTCGADPMDGQRLRLQKSSFHKKISDEVSIIHFVQLNDSVNTIRFFLIDGVWNEQVFKPARPPDEIRKTNCHLFPIPQIICT